MSTTHDLKVLAIFYVAVADGRKTFEVRKNDRGFHLGDTLRLHEIDDNYEPTGRVCEREVTYVLNEFVTKGVRVIAEGYVVLGHRSPYDLPMPERAHPAPTPSLRDAMAAMLSDADDMFSGDKEPGGGSIFYFSADLLLALLVQRNIVCEHGETKPHGFEKAHKSAFDGWGWCSGPALPKEAQS